MEPCRASPRSVLHFTWGTSAASPFLCCLAGYYHGLGPALCSGQSTASATLESRGGTSCHCFSQPFFLQQAAASKAFAGPACLRVAGWWGPCGPWPFPWTVLTVTAAKCGTSAVRRLWLTLLLVGVSLLHCSCCVSGLWGASRCRAPWLQLDWECLADGLSEQLVELWPSFVIGLVSIAGIVVAPLFIAVLPGV